MLVNALAVASTRVQLLRERARHQGTAAGNKRVPFLLDDSVGPVESIVSPCEVCAKPVELLV